MPTIDMPHFDVEYYPLYSNTIEPFTLDTNEVITFTAESRFDAEEAVMEEDPLQSRLHRLGAQYYEFEPIIAPFTHFPTGYIELVKEPRFNADEVIAFIEGSDGA